MQKNHLIIGLRMHPIDGLLNLFTRAHTRGQKYGLAFSAYVLKEWPVKEVARALSVSTTHVYVNKHRISGMLKAELKRLQREL